MNFQDKFKPARNHIKRDAVILKAVSEGVSYSTAAAAAGMSSSRARIVAKRLASRLVREARREDPSVPVQYEFKVEDFTSQPGVWKQRLEKYLPIIEEDYANA